MYVHVCIHTWVDMCACVCVCVRRNRRGYEMSCRRRYSICELLDMASGCWDLSSRPQDQSRVCTIALFLIVLFLCYTYLFCVWGVLMPCSVKWRSVELVLSLYHVDLRDSTQLPGLATSAFICLAISLNL